MSTTRGLTAMERQRREDRRAAAADLFDQDVPPAEIARQLGVTRQAVHQWHRLWEDGGRQALASTGPPGARCYLSEEQVETLKADLERGAVTHGWQTERWTVPRIRVLIHETTGVWYSSLGSLWMFPHHIGFTCQRPEERASERDEEAVRTWREQTWPRVKQPRRTSTPGSSSRTSPPQP
ncbi:winged helix-turn-helix domain-containing protein [Streptomyces sp. NPDC005065]|uniref:winged helix-turn-helix domain-containing protein n=1 Tax=unclassified Streptomyces TaxID=2593676 RepID=UPI0033A5698F